MAVNAWFERSRPLAGAPGVHGLEVTREQWQAAAAQFAAAGGRLLALWAGGEGDAERWVRAAFASGLRAIVLELPLSRAEGDFPGLEEIFPAASRMQRAAADLCGVKSTDPDRRPWLRHGAWPQGYFPLRDAKTPSVVTGAATETYAFVRVEGDGVHEIPVGPVHAGIIEPGHFRFSVVGEKVLRLEERLGYTHKGIERRFTELPALEAHRLAARVSGDSTAAYTWAYCQALEGLAGIEIPARAAWLRALCLELERIANHLGDLGALGNDAGFAFGIAQFSRLKEAVLRATEQTFGQRYLFDAIVPGGIGTDVPRSAGSALRRCATEIAAQVLLLRDIYDEHSGVRDRFVGAGAIPPQLAVRLGLTGLAGRASGQAQDLRVDMPCVPYRELEPVLCGHRDGDVAARVAVRFAEVLESCRLVHRIVEGLPGGARHVPLPPLPEQGLGLGLIEAWRGPVLLALEPGPRGSIRRCHPHDPSWQNWPALEHAIIDNIVPDFPLINKSFNLSYSGHDL
jgi:Ni,Fe-hydrogenase III large subunit